MAVVVDCGGSVLGAALDIPGVGRCVSVTDSQGNRASMLQPSRGTAPPA